MRRQHSLSPVAILCVAMITACTPAATGPFTATDLANEEAKFAAYSVKNGMRAAFLEFFAKKSWLLRPDPVDAQAWISARPDPKIVLNWESARTALSASGDLGFSTGPSIYRSKTEPKAPAGHGQFFSVWQKQKNGEWKVLIDHGISHPPTATPDALPHAALLAIDLAAGSIIGNTPADDAERQFTAQSIPPYAEVITPRTRLLREGQFPIDGQAAINEYMKSPQGKWSWTTRLNGASAANDFAYALGDYTCEPTEAETRRGKYVRVWVRDRAAAAARRWTLLSEVLTPDPPPKS